MYYHTLIGNSGGIALRFLACTLLTIILVGCDSTEAEDDNNNTNKSFTATVSGSRSETMSGSALSVESRDNTGTSWGVSLNDIDKGFSILFAWESGTPSNGTYTFTDPSTATTFDGIVTLTSLLDLYQASSGTVTVRSSSASRVEGDFTFSAAYSGLDQALTGTTVSVQGSFSSTNVIDDDTD